MPNGSQNYELVGNNCQNIEDLTVTLTVTEDLVMDIGFSLQLNVLPQPQERQLQPQPYPGISLNWLQYVLYFQNTQFSAEVQYWSIGAPASTPQEPTPWLPYPTENDLPYPFGPALTSNRIPAGSILEIALTTDSEGRVTGATFTVTIAGTTSATYARNFAPSAAQLLSYPNLVDPVAQYTLAAFEGRPRGSWRLDHKYVFLRRGTAHLLGFGR